MSYREYTARAEQLRWIRRASGVEPRRGRHECHEKAVELQSRQPEQLTGLVVRQRPRAAPSRKT
jgi:hypothetical protein